MLDIKTSWDAYAPVYSLVSEIIRVMEIQFQAKAKFNLVQQVYKKS